MIWTKRWALAPDGRPVEESITWGPPLDKGDTRTILVAELRAMGVGVPDEFDDGLAVIWLSMTTRIIDPATAGKNPLKAPVRPGYTLIAQEGYLNALRWWAGHDDDALAAIQAEQDARRAERAGIVSGVADRLGITPAELQALTGA